MRIGEAAQHQDSHLFVFQSGFPQYGQHFDEFAAVEGILGGSCGGEMSLLVWLQHLDINLTISTSTYSNTA